jgi:formylglycine-generating enzyme required for sulfatase activity
MKLRFLILMLLLAAVAPPALPQHTQGPLTKDQVMDLVRYGMSSTDLAEKIKKLSIDFDPTDDYLQALRKAGAEDAVIQALRAARPKPLTPDQVGKLVAGGVPSQRAVTLVKQHGIDFLADEKYLQTLRLAGADDTLIAAVREASAAARATALAPSSGAVRENPTDGLEYVWIPPGTFMMGCSPGDNECYDDEKPSHRVSLSKGFWIGQTEVTVAAYKRFAGRTGRTMPTAPDFNPGLNNEQMPIVNVSWDDAQAYCAWAGGQLPTEAEWEYAARAGSTEARHGSLDEVAWCNTNSRGQTHPVGEKRGNGFGLHDMLGNVWEWVNDWYDQNYYQSSPPRDPTGPTSGQQRVLRGGSWGGDPRRVRVSCRDWNDPGVRSFFNGVRCRGEVSAP